MKSKLQLSAALISSVIVLSAPAHSVEVKDLYRAEVIVTGTDEPERTRGLRMALREVFAKLTGDARLATDERLSDVLGDPHQFVAEIEYEDRMKGIPVHDEQGTRERPHYLRATFDPKVVDVALSASGLEKWPPDRPLVAVWLAIRTPSGDYVLTDQGGVGYGQRAVLIETAQRLGVPILLPDSNRGSLSINAIIERQPDDSDKFLGRTNAALMGVLSARSDAFWDMDWELLGDSDTQHWSLRQVTFDKALGAGIEETARYLSRPSR